MVDVQISTERQNAVLTFDLFLSAGRGGYRARVLNSPVGEAAVAFRVPVAPDAFAQQGWFPAPVRARLRYWAKATPPLAGGPRELGELLYKAVFAGAVGSCFLRSLDVARSQRCALRLRLRIDAETPELAQLPWETLYATDLQRFLALSDLTPLVRYLELPYGGPALIAPPPLCILGVAASPTDLPALNVELEWNRLSEAVRPLEQRGLIKLQRLEPASLARLQEHLRQETVHILHFIGHSTFEAQSGEGVLVLANAGGQAELVSANRLSIVLHDHAALRLVFLNGCATARSTQDQFFAGLAGALLQQNIPAVIAIQSEIADAAALALSREFYRALADGYAVDLALTEARKAMYAAGDDRAWGAPLLFSRSADNQLFILPPHPLRQSFVRKPFEPEMVLVEGGPFLMGSDSTPEEQPAHSVELPAYWIGKYPVTNREYAEFLQRNKLQEEPKKLGWFLRRPPDEKLNHPVVGVSWHDARAYCAWLSQATGRNYRLPSEAEWEKAARGVDGRSFPWGEQWIDGQANIGSTDTTPVDQYQAGASPYGCLDQLGNGQEWTQTIWGSRERECDYPYPYRPDDGREHLPADDPNSARVLRVHRGGSLRSAAADVRCSARAAADPLSKVTWRGFRVVLTLPAGLSAP